MTHPLLIREKDRKSEKPQWEVADVFRLYGESYRNHHNPPGSTQKIMHDIETCRTAVKGGHVNQCDQCGHIEIAYNSCGNRHCPKCQALSKARWLEARQAELLPVGYFHNVFTLPHELNEPVLRNKKELFNLLFVSVKRTLESFAQDSRNGLAGQLGFTSVLHTWDQKLNAHFHLHCIIPAGVLSCDKKQWIGAKESFLFHVKALGIVFRGKFLEGLEQAHQQGKLQLPSLLGHSDQKFTDLINGLYTKVKTFKSIAR